MEHSEMMNHLDGLAEWMLDRGILPVDGVELCTVAIASIINANCANTHDRARSLDTVLGVLSKSMGVAIRTRHLADDGSDKILN